MTDLRTSQHLARALVDVSRSLIAKGSESAGFDTTLFDDLDRFTHWAPFDVLSKGGEGGDKIGYISGVATTEAPDADGDIILTAGIDWTYFIGDGFTKGKGFIIDEHPVGNHNLVGYPIAITPTEVQHRGVLYKGTNVKAGIYLEDPRGKQLFEKSCTMRRAGGERRLGFSIEGSVLPGGRRGKVVEKSQVKWLAITAAPKNELSWWEPVAKSIMAAAGHGTAGPTQTDQHLTAVLAQVMKSLSGDQTSDELAEALLMRICKAHPDLTWRQATDVLQQVLKTASMSPT